MPYTPISDKKGLAIVLQPSILNTTLLKNDIPASTFQPSWIFHYIESVLFIFMCLEQMLQSLSVCRCVYIIFKYLFSLVIWSGRSYSFYGRQIPAFLHHDLSIFSWWRPLGTYTIHFTHVWHFYIFLTEKNPTININDLFNCWNTITVEATAEAIKFLQNLIFDSARIFRVRWKREGKAS